MRQKVIFAGYLDSNSILILPQTRYMKSTISTRQKRIVASYLDSNRILILPPGEVHEEDHVHDHEAAEEEELLHLVEGLSLSHYWHRERAQTYRNIPDRNVRYMRAAQLRILTVYSKLSSLTGGTFNMFNL